MPLKQIFRRKSVAALNLTDKNNQLSKSLSLFQLVCLGVGMVIGAGIFVLTGLAAGEHAGPAVTLSFTLAGFICICAGIFSRLSDFFIKGFIHRNSLNRIKVELKFIRGYQGCFKKCLRSQGKNFF